MILRQTFSHGVQRTLSHLKALATRTIGRWQTVEPQYKHVLLGLGVSIALIVVILAVWKIPQRQLAPLKAKIQRAREGQRITELERLKLEHDARKLENEARTTLVQALGGLALLIGLYFTAKTWRTTREGQITDRFTKAINHLGEAGPEKLAIRLGGIYALERIARDSERDHWPIMEILTVYVREHAPWPPKDIQLLADDLPPKLATDIQAILTVLGRRGRSFGKGEDRPLDLSFTDLRRAALTDAHLESAVLWGTHLEDAVLIFCHFEGMLLHQAYLDRAQLIKTNLNVADLWKTCLERTLLWGTHLKGAKNLTLEQVIRASALDKAHLDLLLREQIRQQHPELLKSPE